MKSTMKENYTPEMHNLIYTAAKAVFEQGKDSNKSPKGEFHTIRKEIYIT